MKRDRLFILINRRINLIRVRVPKPERVVHQRQILLITVPVLRRRLQVSHRLRKNLFPQQNASHLKVILRARVPGSNPFTHSFRLIIQRASNEHLSHHDEPGATENRQERSEIKRLDVPLEFTEFKQLLGNRRRRFNRRGRRAAAVRTRKHRHACPTLDGAASHRHGRRRR